MRLNYFLNFLNRYQDELGIDRYYKFLFIVIGSLIGCLLSIVSTLAQSSLHDFNSWNNAIIFFVFLSNIVFAFKKILDLPILLSVSYFLMSMTYASIYY